MKRMLAVLLCFCCAQFSAHAEEHGLTKAQRAYNKGLAWLLTNQNKDGSWGTFESARPDEVWLGTVASHKAFGDATSALCVMALINPARTNEKAATALSNGLKYLLDAPLVLRADDMTLYNTWTHIYVLDAMCSVLNESTLAGHHERARKVATQQIEGLRTLQGSEGGFGYYDFNFAAARPTGSESTSFMTGAALLALDRARAAGVEVSGSMLGDGLKCLTRLRLPDGAYIYGTYAQNGPRRLYNRVNGSLGRSQVCNLALHKFQAGVTQADMAAGLENLFKYHHFIEMGKGRRYPHEAWYSTAGYYFFFGHYYAARVAHELTSEDREKYLPQLRDVIARLQDADGSWWDFPLYGYHKPYGTAFALMTLELTQP